MSDIFIHATSALGLALPLGFPGLPPPRPPAPACGLRAAATADAPCERGVLAYATAQCVYAVDPRPVAPYRLRRMVTVLSTALVAPRAHHTRPPQAQPTHTAHGHTTHESRSAQACRTVQPAHSPVTVTHRRARLRACDSSPPSPPAPGRRRRGAGPGRGSPNSQLYRVYLSIGLVTTNNSPR